MLIGIVESVIAASTASNIIRVVRGGRPAYSIWARPLICLSNFSGEETTVDLVMSGLYGGFADNEVGEERTQQFQTIITGAFQDNYPEALLNQTSDAQPEDDNDIFLDPSG